MLLAVRRDTEDQISTSDEPTIEGIVKGGLLPEHLAEVLGEDDSSPSERSTTTTPSPIRQGGLRPEDFDEGQEEQVQEEQGEPMYPEDEDCGPNEKFTKCGHICRESFKFIRKKRRCPQSCKRGCFCKKGFYRDGFKNCNQVPQKYLKDIFGGQTKKDPTQLKCLRQNEKYDDCGDRCVESLANLNPIHVLEVVIAMIIS